jgi:hypothetical protein
MQSQCLAWLLAAVRPDDQDARREKAMQNQDHKASDGKTRIFEQEPF